MFYNKIMSFHPLMVDQSSIRRKGCEYEFQILSRLVLGLAQYSYVDQKCGKRALIAKQMFDK